MSTPTLTQSDLMELKKLDQREKTRQRMARYRAQLKTLPSEAQEAAHERARTARARYRANHRLQLRLYARGARAKEYTDEHGIEAYQAKMEAKMERKRLKQLEDEQRCRRVVRPKSPKPSRKPRSPHSGPQNRQPFPDAIRPME
ncbi:hypothetical protein C8F04DRAFT_1252415 [Mycena alexandri]|uniref:Uncharacterized protein n=1 Tax=Mycena alexandri TaxID=1745969 RepID=A0AAD6X7J1_9AGAR|nr:hypothetical protein C8F04DRAFT_1252415 [Mycena alexandri]